MPSPWLSSKVKYSSLFGAYLIGLIQYIKMNKRVDIGYVAEISRNLILNVDMDWLGLVRKSPGPLVLTPFRSRLFEFE